MSETQLTYEVNRVKQIQYVGMWTMCPHGMWNGAGFFGSK